MIGAIPKLSSVRFLPDWQVNLIFAPRHPKAARQHANHGNCLPIKTNRLAESFVVS